MRTCGLIVACLLLAACGKGSGDQTSRSAGVVHVYNWSDYIAEDTLPSFEQASKLRVVYDVYDSNEVLEAKLMAGRSGYDLVFPSARPFAERHIQSGVYQPLDRDRLANYGNLDPSIMAGLSDIDPGNAHLVPYMWGTTGLGINVKQVRERLGADVALDSWALLFDPANAEKLADCGISVLDDDQETFGAALIWLGRDPNAHAADEVDAVTQAYAAIRPHVRYFHSSKYIDDLANGDVCLAMGYSGDVLQARDRAVEANNGVEIAYVIPKEGALRWIDVMAIPKDAPNPAAAHALIDHLLKPEVIAKVSEAVGYANANQAATALLDAELTGNPGVYPPPEVMAKLIDPKSLPQDQQRARVRGWTTIKTGR